MDKLSENSCFSVHSNTICLWDIAAQKLLLETKTGTNYFACNSTTLLATLVGSGSPYTLQFYLLPTLQALANPLGDVLNCTSVDEMVCVFFADHFGLYRSDLQGSVSCIASFSYSYQLELDGDYHYGKQKNPSCGPCFVDRDICIYF